MDIAIVGASGFVGSSLVKEAVRRGYNVTAIARHPDKIDDSDEKVTARKGDVFEVEPMAELLEGHDAVLSTFNPGWDNPNIYDDYMKGAPALQEAVKKAGVNRFIVVGGAGSLEIEPGKQLVDTPDFPEEYKQGALAARDYLDDILRKEDELDWTFLSPAILMHPGIDTGRTGEYRIGTDQPVFDENGESKISAEDLCVALLDELENNRFIKQRFTVAY